VRLSKLEGREPLNLKGTDVLGISNHSGKFDGSTKIMGITSIDGVLYAALNGMGKGEKITLFLYLLPMGLLCITAPLLNLRITGKAGRLHQAI
jgi:hypothetical protein